MHVTTQQQRHAMKRLYLRAKAADHPTPLTYLQWRRTVVYYPSMGCLMVEALGMHIGIEPDGYTHS